jgi:hypothetical protein
MPPIRCDDSANKNLYDKEGNAKQIIIQKEERRRRTPASNSSLCWTRLRPSTKSR